MSLRSMLLILLATGCGGRGAALLTIDAIGPNGRLVIPAEIDRLTISAVDRSATRVLDETGYELTGSSFPVTLGVDPGTRTGTVVRFTVVGTRSNVTVATAVADVELESRRVTDVTLTLSTE